jgi:hypothetical protein
MGAAAWSAAVGLEAVWIGIEEEVVVAARPGWP